MAVLVTGGAGYIGSHMVYELMDNGVPVVVLDDLSAGQRWLLPEDVPLFIGKCGDEKLVSAILNAFGVDTIFHFAAAIVVPESVQKPFHYYENNTAESRTLFETAVKHGVRNIIFSSSAAVYGEPDAAPITEDAALRPVSPYGSSKLMTEIMLRDAAAAHGIRYVALRYFNVAGADPAGRTGQSGANASHIIKVAVQAALGVRDHVSIFGEDYPTPDGTCVRDYVHVTDLVKAHAAACNHLAKGGESLTLNCGYGHGYSVKEVVDAVRRVSGVRFTVKHGPRRPGDPAELVASNERIRSALNWRPSLDDLDGMIAHALAWEERLRCAERPQPRRAAKVLSPIYALEPPALSLNAPPSQVAGMT